MHRGEMGLARALSSEMTQNQQALESERQRLIKIERDKLDKWLVDENNQSLAYYEPIRQARFLISDDNSDDVLADFKAMNEAIETKDATNLFERARAHMECANPAMALLGGALAGVGLTIAIACLVLGITCPVVGVIAGLALLGGLLGVGAGINPKPSIKTATFFNAVKAIDPELADCGDLLKLPSP